MQSVSEYCEISALLTNTIPFLYLLLRGAASLAVPVLGAVLHVGEVPLRLARTVLVRRLHAGGGGGG